jgi:hypothetical protein
MSVTRFQIARVGDPRVGAQIWPYDATGTPTGIAANNGDIAINSVGEIFKYNGTAWIDQDFALVGPSGANGTNGARGTLWYDYTGTGTPAEGTFSGELPGDLCFRSSDGEVFQRGASSWTDLGLTLKGGNTNGTGSLGGSLFPYSGTGTPTGFTGMVNGDFSIREIDGEVFKYVSASTTWIDQNWSVGTGQGNAVLNTISRGFLNQTQTISTNAWTLVTLNAEDSGDDPNANFSTTTHLYTCRTAGRYLVLATVGLSETSSGSGTAQGFVSRNGAPAAGVDSSYIGEVSNLPASGSFFASGGTIMTCAVGDTIGLYALASAAGVTLSEGSDYLTTMSVTMLAPLQNAPVTPNTGARAYRQSAYTPSTGASWVAIPFDTVDANNDPGGHFTAGLGSTGAYLVGVSGWHDITGHIEATVGSTALNLGVGVAILHNGSVVSENFTPESDSSGYARIGLADKIYCSAGDTLQLATFTGYALRVGTSTVFLSIVKVDQPVPGGQGPPIGSQVLYTGSGDPLPGQWVIADGRLISSVTYAGFAATDPNNNYNGGVSPGTNLKRLPDKRGVKSVGAINMGSALGAGSNDNAHAQLSIGSSGGEVVDTISIATLPSHIHTDAGHGHSFGQNMPGSAPGEWVGVDVLPNNGAGSVLVPETSGGVNNVTGTQNASANIQPTGTGGAHNNMDPYQADSVIVRIA